MSALKSSVRSFLSGKFFRDDTCKLLVFTDHPGCKNTILKLSNMESLSGVVLEIICALTEENRKAASVVKQDFLL